MEITKFVVEGREKALLFGDYKTYRSQLSSRVLNIRKRLGRTTRKGAKYSNKAPITAQDIGSNREYVHLQLSIAERAWAHAMFMKSEHAADTKGITGSTRSHIISRLHKASIYAIDVATLLNDRATTGAIDTDLLEARAYAASLNGAVQFEKQSWEECLKEFAEARVIYSALELSTKSDTFRDLLTGTIDPSIRYGAYQLRIPRTAAIPAIAKKYFPTGDAELVGLVEKLQPGTLKEQKSSDETTATDNAPKTITWRSRQVDIEDASIAATLASVNAAAEKLGEVLSASGKGHSKEDAAAYDDILIKSQDAVDATKSAIDELTSEGVGQGDKRMQSLQITRTAISYDLISWRIGRNRVLSGPNDGALIEGAPIAKSKKSNRSVSLNDEGFGRQLARLREKVVMYDATLQSLDSVKELPGVAADTAFLQELDAKFGYFQALKCLAIARSHALLSNHKNALALIARASTLMSQVSPILVGLNESDNEAPPSLTLYTSSVEYLHTLLQGELQRHRALLEIHTLTSQPSANNTAASSLPLIEKMTQYPPQNVDPKNLVSYPPKLEAAPVKPLFFDVAWNYIDYPGQERQVAAATKSEAETAAPAQTQEQPAQKKGWFGFGR